MATTIYPTDTATDDLTVGDEDLLASIGTPGGGLAVSTTNTSTVVVTCTRTAGGTILGWFTNPLNAVTISGTVTFNVWMAESNMSANVDAGVVVQRRSNTGTFISTIVDSGKGTEAPVTTRAAQNWTASPTSTTLADGDRLKIIIQCKDSISQASGFTFTMGFAGTTGAADGDTFVTFTETITEQGGAAANPPRSTQMIQLLAH